MAREMFSFRIDSGLRDVLAARAERENRSVSNMAEVLLEAALTAVAGKGRPLTHDELTKMLVELDLKPTVNTID